MATNSDPLAPFDKLGPSVYMQDPADVGGKDNRPVVFIAFWMNAPPRALAKYAVEYRRLIPTARIIFVRSSSNDFFLQATENAQRVQITPAVEAIRSFVAPENPVFMHLFSNGGLSKTAHLLKAYKAATGQPLPFSAMVVDSAPGTAKLSSAVRAFSFALPRMWILRLFGKGLLYIFLVTMKLIQSITRSPDVISCARKTINDLSLVQAVNKKGVPVRCYMYSETDDLVDYRDVEMHASESEAAGWLVQCERFQGSPHVGHMRAAPDRYWGIVKEHLELSSSTT
ncbi:hypothetical protein N7533_006943 [Penicillium manginii]|jgi:hypothetical protein|uniref:uncharacterized protein n=1 Tax=Penicillium manginii TaxID=203109 RepID=UPI0025488BB5|nr:uncharacterized protein N7533_006943 [Penicillium manginii]KAJ5749915.1 hypothetical protein N7533_006943 [Penicillium manginii]